MNPVYQLLTTEIHVPFWVCLVGLTLVVLVFLLQEAVKSLSAKVEIMEAKLLLAHKTLLENHQWHQDHDDYDGYTDSELCNHNVEAIQHSCVCSVCIKDKV